MPPTRRQIFTAAAHQVLLENPEMYRNISNLQSLRREQAGRWGQRILLLNDPGPGLVEQAYMNADEINDKLPKLLDTRAKVLKGIQDRAAEGLKGRTGMDETLGRILIANINAEGQTKASAAGALANLNATSIEAATKAELAKVDIIKAGLGKAAPKDEAGIARVNDMFTAATAQDTAGGGSPTAEAKAMLQAASNAELAGLLYRAHESNDQTVYDNVLGAIKAAGKDEMVTAFIADQVAKDKGSMKRLNAFGADVLRDAPEGMPIADLVAREVRGTMLNSGPARGKMLRETLNALGDPELKKQLDDAIAQVVSPEEKATLAQLDDSIEKAMASKDLASPTETREQIRSAEGSDEEFRKGLHVAGMDAENDTLIGMGAAFRRAARQQARGLVKVVEGEDDNAELKTRRLSLSRAQALARRNKAAGWAKRKGQGVDPPTNADGGSGPPEEEEGEKAEEEELKVGGGGLPPTPKEDAPEPTEGGEAPAAPSGMSAYTARTDAATVALDASRAARRTEAAAQLRELLRSRERVEAEEPEEAVADNGPPARPPGYWRTQPWLS